MLPLELLSAAPQRLDARAAMEAMAAHAPALDALFGELAQAHRVNIVGGAFPYAARRAIRYGDGWIPRADRLEKDGVGVIIDKFRIMAREAGRDPASLPITIFRVPEIVDQLKFCQEIGVDRLTLTIDHWR